MSRELTNREIKRQDFVDDEIYDLICSLFPYQSISPIEWDIEIISEIRESLICYYESICMVGRLDWDEMKFYPYIEWTDKEKEILNGNS